VRGGVKNFCLAEGSYLHITPVNGLFKETGLKMMTEFPE
jgi:hypothetical protein